MSSYHERRRENIRKLKEAADIAAKNPNKENLQNLQTIKTLVGVSFTTAGVSKENQLSLKSLLKKNLNGKKDKNQGKNVRSLPEKNQSQIHV